MSNLGRLAYPSHKQIYEKPKAAFETLTFLSFHGKKIKHFPFMCLKEKHKSERRKFSFQSQSSVQKQYQNSIKNEISFSCYTTNTSGKPQKNHL